MEIGGLEKSTLIDYPAKVACTVFLIGCNFRCPFCYSSELVLPEKIKSQPRISEKEFFDFLKKRKGLLEGVVVCGGEPTLNKDLPNFIKKIKKLGYKVKLDTNGSNPEMLEELTKKKLLDYVAMDIKAPFSKTESRNGGTKVKKRRESSSPYDRAVGVKIDLSKIKKSIGIIKNSGIDYEFRTTVVPTIHTKEDIIKIAKAIAPAKKYFLQNFRPEKTIDPEFEKIKSYSKDFLSEIKEEIAEFFGICEVRN